MLKLEQLLVAPQGSWQWQQRLRWVIYTPVRLRDGRIVWGKPREGNHVSGGNLRSPNCRTGERSRYMSPLSPCELWSSATNAVIHTTF